MREKRLRITALNQNQNCKSEHKDLEAFEESKKVVRWQMQPLGLDCYQNEMRQGESRTESHSHSRRRHIRYSTTTVLKVTKSAFYSNHVTHAGPIATSFLKSKALLNTDGKNKNHT